MSQNKIAPEIVAKFSAWQPFTAISGMNVLLALLLTLFAGCVEHKDSASAQEAALSGQQPLNQSVEPPDYSRAISIDSAKAVGMTCTFGNIYLVGDSAVRTLAIYDDTVSAYIKDTGIAPRPRQSH